MIQWIKRNPIRAVAIFLIILLLVVLTVGLILITVYIILKYIKNKQDKPISTSELEIIPKKGKEPKKEMKKQDLQKSRKKLIELRDKAVQEYSSGGGKRRTSRGAYKRRLEGQDILKYNNKIEELRIKIDKLSEKTPK